MSIEFVCQQCPGFSFFPHGLQVILTGSQRWEIFLLSVTATILAVLSEWLSLAVGLQGRILKDSVESVWFSQEKL